MAFYTGVQAANATNTSGIIFTNNTTGGHDDAVIFTAAFLCGESQTAGTVTSGTAMAFGEITGASGTATTAEQGNSRSPALRVQYTPSTALLTISGVKVALPLMQCIRVEWRGDYRRSPATQGADGVASLGAGSSSNANFVTSYTVFCQNALKAYPPRRMRRGREPYFMFSDQCCHQYAKSGSGSFTMASRPHWTNDGITFIDATVWQLGFSAWSAALYSSFQNFSPTVALNTTDGTTFSTGTPTLEFTGTDTEGDNITYELQIGTNSNLDSLITDASYSDTTDGSYSENSVSTFDMVGESFVSNGGKLANAKFFLSKSGAPTGNATAVVYAWDSGGSVPTGSVLATSDNFDVSTLTTTKAQITFNFSGANQISLVAGTTYAVMVNYTGSSGSDFINVWYVTTGAYSGGIQALHIGGDGWSNDTVKDTNFVVSVSPVLLDKFSAVNAGFLNEIHGGDTDPFNSGDKIGFTVQSADTLAVATYYWRAQGKDPTGSNAWGGWATTRSFIVQSGKTGTTTEAISTSEAATRTGTFVRATSEAPTTSEVASRTGTFVRTATEAISTSEVASKALQTARTATDASHTAEVASRTGSFHQPATESISTSEAITRPSTFYRFAGKAFTNYTAFTIDHTKCGASDSTNWVALFNTIDSRFKTVANGGHVQNSNGYDICPYSDSALTSPLTYELERYNATTGEVVMHILLPTLSHTADTTIYLAYGNGAISGNGSNAGVWTNGFVAVYHLKNGTTVDPSDAIGNYNGSVLNGPLTAAAGQIDGGWSNNASGQTIINASIPQGAAMTYSMWFKPTSLGVDYMGLLNKGQTSTDYAGIYAKSNGKLYCVVRAGGSGGSTTVSYDGTGTHTLVNGTWYHLAMTYDSTNGLIGYVNAASDNTVAASSTLNTTLNETDLGRQASTGTRQLNGVLDEVRIANVSRSADWLLQEYNNQNSPSTFYSLGSEVIAGGESISTSESATGVKGGASYSRTASESISTAEVASRTGTFVRSTTEAPTTAEVASRTGTFVRSATDAPTTAEVASRTGTFVRSTTEAPTTSEVASRTGSFHETATDALTTSESVNRAGPWSRTATDAPHTSEVASRTGTFVRSTTDAPTTAEVASRTGTFVRAATDAPNTVESVTGTKSSGITRNTTESISTAESLTRIFTGVRTTTESPHTSEVIANGLSHVRTTSESLATAEVVSRIGSFHQGVTDAPHTSEVIAKSVTTSRTATDAPHTSEVSTRVLAAVRSTTDAPAISEIITLHSILMRSAFDYPATAEAVDAQVQLPTYFQYIVDFEAGQKSTRSALAGAGASSSLGVQQTGSGLASCKTD